MTPMPKGRAVDANRIDQVMDALAPLSLDDVRPAQGSPEAAGQHRLVYRLYDGREITIYPMAEGEDRYTLRVAARQIAGAAAVDAATEPEAPGDKKSAENTDEEDEPAIQTAQEINAALGPWRFSIKKWQYDSFVTRPESLLEEVKKDG